MNTNQEDSPKAIRWLTTNRLEALVDGIFAFAMTLLVVGIDIPTIPETTANQELPKALSALWPKFSSYILSFVLLAIFWIIHHKQFRSIKRINESFIWINILILMFIVFIPFSTQLIGEYENVRLANVIFELNMLIIGMLFYIQWTYALNNNLTDLAPGGLDVTLSKKRNLVIPIVSLLAIALSLLTPQWSTLIYLAIPFIMIKYSK